MRTITVTFLANCHRYSEPSSLFFAEDHSEEKTASKDKKHKAHIFLSTSNAERFTQQLENKVQRSKFGPCTNHCRFLAGNHQTECTGEVTDVVHVVS